jgi:hypothetical protein
MKTYIVTVTPPVRSLLETSRLEIEAESQAHALRIAGQRPGCTYSVREADVSSYCVPFADSAMQGFDEERALA